MCCIRSFIRAADFYADGRVDGAVFRLYLPLQRLVWQPAFERQQALRFVLAVR